MNAQHLTTDELADAAEGLLDLNAPPLPNLISPTAQTAKRSRTRCVG